MAAEESLSGQQFSLPTMYRGGSTHSHLENDQYATSDFEQAHGYGSNVKEVTPRFSNPIEVHHTPGLGKGWRDYVEEALPGPGDWRSKMVAHGHDGLIYRWHPGKTWTVGLGKR